jgi:hypothetical protein
MEVVSCELSSEWFHHNMTILNKIAFREDDVTTGAALYFLINELLVYCSDKHRAS